MHDVHLFPSAETLLRFYHYFYYIAMYFLADFIYFSLFDIFQCRFHRYFADSKEL